MYLNNRNTTIEDFENIKNIITTKYEELKEENIESIFVKQLPDADLIFSNKRNSTTGKTSHIACTSDSMKFFHSILGKDYVENGELCDKNIFEIFVEAKYIVTDNIPNDSEKDNFSKTVCTIWVNKKSNGENQIGLSKKESDGETFKKLREQMYVDDVLIFFKYNDSNNLKTYVILLKHNYEYDKNLINQIGKISGKPKFYDNQNPTMYVDVNEYYNPNLKGINKIYFGAPGTGKSHYVQSKYYDEFAKRVTFHPEYTYNDFVGYIRPVMENKQITYKFVPGVFTEILLEALNNPDNMYSLIIEELNRVNVSAVFGDLFQLLDRQANGFSEYKINNLDICTHLIPKLNNKNKCINNSIGIPNNLNIIATMNTSDQNVFVMDTAFKRRWDFEYLKISFENDHSFKDNKIINLNISWENFVTTINKFMMSEENEDLMISEDKQIGPYFIKADDLNDSKKFGYKVLLYLWDDVFKMSRDRIFNNTIRTFSDLIDKFSSDNSIDIFNKNLCDELKQYVITIPVDKNSNLSLEDESNE